MTVANAAAHNGRVTKSAAPVKPKLRLLAATVQFRFVVDCGGDDLEEMGSEPKTMGPKEWREYMAGGFRRELAKAEAQLAEDAAPAKPTNAASKRAANGSTP
jgi:hypothetical protein